MDKKKILLLFGTFLLSVRCGESVPTQECGCSIEKHDYDVKLDCTFRSIEQIDFDCVAEKKPTKLNLSRTGTTNEILQYLYSKGGFENLKYLDISYNNIEYLHGSWIKNLNLTHLDVSYTNVVVADVILLNANISIIIADGNPCKCDNATISNVTYNAMTEGKLQKWKCIDSDGILKPFIDVPSCYTHINGNTENSNWLNWKILLIIVIAVIAVIVITVCVICYCYFKQKRTRRSVNITAANEDAQKGHDGLTANYNCETTQVYLQ